MSEFRQNPITKEWVIIAPERARRPRDLAAKELPKELPRVDPECPFCPGNEGQTGGEIHRIGGPGLWEVRVVPNKYAAVSRDGKRTRTNVGLKRTASAVGQQEVVVEAPEHNTSLALLPLSHVEKVVRCYKERYIAISEDPRVELITIFKNHGTGGGASMAHPHSQVMATPIISPQVRSRMEEALRFFDEVGDCIFCKVLLDEIYDSKRIVAENPHFVSFVPFAALSPFHVWIFPRRHMASFGETRDNELNGLASIVRETLARLYYGLENPDYNYTVRTAPSENRYCKYYHWYMSIIPRMHQMAGFELGSGFFVNMTLPEENAEFLRNVQLPHSFFAASA